MTKFTAQVMLGVMTGIALSVALFFLVSIYHTTKDTLSILNKYELTCGQ